MTPNLVTIVQARTGSSRFPRKILQPVLGEPLLLRQLERVSRAKLTGTVVVATTTEPEDDEVQAICERRGIPVFRGHPLDLLDRHVSAARAFRAGHAVKIPSDCPLIDPGAINRVLGFYLEHLGQYDYVSNLHPPSYPDGNDVEVMPLSILETAWEEAVRPLDREHTTPFIWDHPERFRIGNVTWETGLDYSMSHRFTLDYSEDYEFISLVYERLYPRRPYFTIRDILELLDEEPRIAEINARYAGINWYRHHMGALRTIGPEMTRTLETT